MMKNLLRNHFHKLLIGILLFASTTVQAQNGLHFDGTSDYVEIPTSTSLNSYTTTGELTIEYWIKPVFPATGTAQIIAKRPPTNDSGLAFELGTTGGATHYIHTSGGWKATGTTYTNNTWQHVAVTAKAGGSLKIYINGVLIPASTVSLAGVTLTPSTSVMRLMTSTIALGSYGQGTLDEVRIWKAERTAAQILDSKDCQLAGTETGLVAYYKFNQGTASGTNTGVTTLTDATTNANNGTLLGTFALSGSTSNWVTGSSVGATPSVAIAASPSGSIVLGTNVTFTATPTNGGTTPSYQWKKNGSNVGTNAATYSDATLANNDVITCALTNNVSCATTTTTTSTGITMSVVPPASALHFDGANDYVEIPTSTSLNSYTTTGELTIEYWIKPVVPTVGFSVFISKRPLTNDGGFAAEMSSLGEVNHFLYTSNGWKTVTVNYTNNTWQHVAITAKAGGSLNVYINGTLVGTPASLSGVTISATTAVMRLMANTLASNAQGTYAQGTMDEVRLWSRALSQCEIQRTMNCELGSGQTNLLAYYKFNQGVGTSLPDISGNNNTGTLSNFALTGTTSNWVVSGGVTSGTTCIPFLPPSVAIVNTTANPVICANSTLSFAATPTNGGSSPSYQWQKNGTNISGAINDTYSASSWADNDVITCVMTSDGCTSISNGLTITTNIPTAGITGTAVACNSVSLTATGGTSYAWSGGSTPSSATNTFTTSGTYTVTVTNAAGCTATVSQEVTVNTPPTVSLSNTGATTCLGTAALSLSSSNTANQIQWYNGTTLVNTATSTPATTGTTVAGGNGLGSAANQLNNPYSVQVDGSGNIYVTDRNNHRIQKWAPGATTGTTVAGGNGQGSATNQFNYPNSVYVDGSGNIYIADGNNYRIQKWAPGATTGTTVAGGNGQGSATNQLSNPSSVYVDGSGNMYIADRGNDRIQKWTPGATTGTTVAGGNGQGSAANQLNFPTSVYVDGSGNIYIADRFNNRIQKWAPGATIGTTVAGGTGGAAANQLNSPATVYVDGSGNIYIADEYNHRIQKWAVGATTGTTVAGGNGQGSTANKLSQPNAVYVDASGNIYISDLLNSRIQKWGSNPAVTTYTPTTVGSYTALVTDVNGCTATTAAFAVNTASTPSVSVTASPSGAIAAGTSVTFTATPTNGGTSPTYQWKKGSTNVGINSATYTDATLANGDIITCVLTPSAEMCTATPTATSTGITMSVSSASNSALHFNRANNYVSCPQTINNRTQFTIETWVKPTFSGDYVPIITQEGVLELAILNGGTLYAVVGSSQYCTTPTTPFATANLGVWKHVALVFDGTATGNTNRLKLYIDGVLQTLSFAGTVPTTSGTTANVLKLGSYNTYGTRFEGTMDEVRFWSRPLAQCEIQNNKNCELGSSQTGLFAYYQFNQASGTSLPDASGNNNTGTLNSFALTGTTSNWVTTGAVTTGTTCTILPTPSVSITASPSGAITAGTSVTFTATPTNGGTSPTYQWKNGSTNVGTNSATYTDATLANGDIITCVLTPSAEMCTATPTATSIGITMSVSSASNSALHFNRANNYVSCPQTINNRTQFTIETWVKPTFSGDYVPIITQEGVLELAILNGGTLYAVVGSSQYCTTPTTPFATANLDVWKHLALVFDGTATGNTNRLKLYIDGVLQTLSFAGTVPTTSGTTANVLKLGSYNTYGTRFEGTMDEVRFWSRPLTQCEIQNNKNCELGSGQTGLFAYYQFNQASGTSLTDVSGSNNTGTLTDFTLSGTTSNWVTTGAVTTGSTCTAYLPPSVAITNTTTNPIICANSTLSFTAAPTNGGTSPTYQWQKNGTNISGATDVTYSASSWADNDVITCVMTSNGCTFTSNGLTITTNIPTAGITGTAVACNSVSLTATGGTSYAWSGGNTPSSATNTFTTSGTYTVTVINAAGCTATTSRGVTVNTPPTVSLSNTGATTCLGTAALSLNSSNTASEIKWYNGETLVNTATSSPSTTGTTVAGGNGYGSAANQLTYPSSVYVDGSGNMYISDRGNHRIQKWAPGATTGTTVAGGNGLGLAANQFENPASIYVDGSGNMYIADYYNHRIQKWAAGASTGTTVAGGNGQGSAANQLSYPSSVYVDGSGNIYIADLQNHRIQKWAAGASTGTTVAGGNGQGSLANQLSSPNSVYVDGFGNIYIADQPNHRIQKWAAGATTGTTVAGGTGGSLANQLSGPGSVYVDGSGNIYICDQYNNRIQKWAAGATTGTTVAGGNGNGSAANQLSTPTSVFVDGSGNIYISDQYNYRIQKWGSGAAVTTYTPTTAGSYTAFVTDANGCTATTAAVAVSAVASPSVSITASPSGAITAGTSVTFTASPTNGGSTPQYQWKKGSTNVGTNSTTYTDATLANGDIITCVLTPSAEICPATPTATSTGITMSVTTTTCDCDPTCSPIPTAAGTYTATRSVTSGGYTHYCAGNNLLLSVKTPTATTIPPAAVKIKIGATTTNFMDRYCNGTTAATACFVSLPGGGVLLNRNWHIDNTLVTGTAIGLTNPLQIVSYFSTAEYNALNSSMTTNSLTPLAGYTGLKLYQSKVDYNFGQFPDPSTIKPSTAVNKYSNGATPSATLWKYANPQTGIHSAEFKVPSLQNSGGIGKFF